MRHDFFSNQIQQFILGKMAMFELPLAQVEVSEPWFIERVVKLLHIGVRKGCLHGNALVRVKSQGSLQKVACFSGSLWKELRKGKFGSSLHRFKKNA